MTAPVIDPKEQAADLKSVGRSVTRVDALEKVTGRAKYPADYSMPGMRFAKVVWAGEPHAKIMNLDTTAAAATPGVIAVLTAKDVPHNEYGLIDSDQQVLADGVVRWIGEPVAIVVAETEDLAATARDLVKVTYEPLPLLLDPLAAMAPGAPVIHPARGTNVLAKWRIRHGDVDRALAEADLVIEAEYRVPMVEHAYLQPEAALGYIDEEGRVTVVVAGQWPHDDVRQIAHALGLPRERVREIVPYIGGAFGGREDISLQILTALAAWKTGRPVKLVWTREESMRCHGKRHPFMMRYRWGAKGGRLTAAKIELVADAGAYSSSSKAVVPGALSVATGPYEIPNVSVDACAVHTNNPPTMAMRGFGTAQPPVAYEQHIDRFARALGEDPISFRLRHLWREGSTQATGGPVPPGIGVRETLCQAALAAGWRREGDGERGDRWVKPDLPPLADGRRHGLGVATAFKNVGYSFGFHDRSTARVVLTLDEAGRPERAELYIGAAEVGMGVHTVLVQIAADGLGLPADRVRLSLVDTSRTPNAGSSSASRHTFVSGRAVLEACRQVLAKRDGLPPGSRSVETEYTFDSQEARPTTDLDPETGACNPHIAYAYVTQIAEVAVDTVTGRVEVLRLISAQDVGRAVNPLMIEGQVGGGVQMGLGYALMEEFKLRDDGRVRTRNFSEYLIPTTLDMPAELTCINVEVPDPLGPYGAKGLGEHVMIPTAPAILNAIRDALGTPVEQLPAGPERIWRVLAEGVSK